MAIDRYAVPGVLVAAALLLWPALWNGYPIVFADTGTYLSQVIHHYVGWDRPVFYSLFMLPLHAMVTLWPVVIVQALLASWVMWVVCRVLLTAVRGAVFAVGVGVLSACTWLPWIVSELMPDFFTPFLLLVLFLLAWVPERLSGREHVALAGLATLMIASQLSSLPLAFVLLGVIVLARLGVRAVGGEAVDGAIGPLRRWLLIVLPPGLALVSLCTVNLVAHGRFAVSPFGNIFLLARVVYDGPGMAALQRDCPMVKWRLCPFLNDFPATSDDFLWAPDSPLNRAGGPKLVSAEAGAIIWAALMADPGFEVWAAWRNMLEQLRRFDSGDGLTPWPVQVSGWIERDFPQREAALYVSARQQRDGLSVPVVMAVVHKVTAVLGVIVCAILLPIAFMRREACAGFLLVVLLALPVSAAITGGLSAPHDRYQSRIMWLAPFAAVVSLVSLRRRPV